MHAPIVVFFYMAISLYDIMAYFALRTSTCDTVSIKGKILIERAHEGKKRKSKGTYAGCKGLCAFQKEAKEYTLSKAAPPHQLLYLQED